MEFSEIRVGQLLERIKDDKPVCRMRVMEILEYDFNCEIIEVLEEAYAWEFVKGRLWQGWAYAAHLYSLVTEEPACEPLPLIEPHIAGLSPERVNWDRVMRGGWTE